MQNKKILLIGNANVGKTTLFNMLCGLNQKTGNYPGITIDKKRGYFTHEEVSIEIIDLPGINSLNPSSLDEELVYNYLLSVKPEEYTVLFLANSMELKKSLFLYSQVRDLGIPTVLALNYSDIAKHKGIEIDVPALEKAMDTDILFISARKKQGLNELKDALIRAHEIKIPEPAYVKEDVKPLILDYQQVHAIPHTYPAFLAYTIEKNEKKLLQKEAILRYQVINQWLSKSFTVNPSKATNISSKLDRFLLHPILGYFAFFMLLSLIFQSVFWLATFPMEWIEQIMGVLKEGTQSALPSGLFNDLLVNGVLEGIGGVVIFIPQIAILFFFFSLLEESGYMSRAVFLLDKVMQKVGMSGKSVVPLVSSFACAVPAIMSTRTIENKKERLITILVSPLITCSARIPVYTIIIAIIIPETYYGPFGLQGLTLMGMYLLGVLTTIIAALAFKYIIKNKFKSFFIIPMPDYLIPSLKNIAYTVWQNVLSFVWNAGKIIVAITILIFVLKSYGNQTFKNAEQIVNETYASLPKEEKDAKISHLKMENSYLASIGKTIEPVITPLGYDWKMGIGVLASVAAREVFIGTMLVVYGGNEEDVDNESLITEQFKKQENVNTGKPAFTFASGLSLLLFYAFSLQCMSTIAVTYKETKSTLWTSVQFIYMTSLAYISALIAFQIFN